MGLFSKWLGTSHGVLTKKAARDLRIGNLLELGKNGTYTTLRFCPKCKHQGINEKSHSVFLTCEKCGYKFTRTEMERNTAIPISPVSFIS